MVSLQSKHNARFSISIKMYSSVGFSSYAFASSVSYIFLFEDDIYGSTVFANKQSEIEKINNNTEHKHRPNETTIENGRRTIFDFQYNISITIAELSIHSIGPPIIYDSLS